MLGEEVEEKVKPRGLFTMEKGGTEVLMVVRNRQIGGGHGEVLALALTKGLI